MIDINKFSERIWSFFRAVILTGVGFIIVYPVLYMLSCAFRDSADMNDPSVMWIPRHFTLSVIKDTVKAMDLGNTLKNTFFLNVGCSVVQVISCAVTGYGFARFDFRGKKILFAIVIMMILVPPQVISLPQYTQFMHFGIGSLRINLIDSMFTMYLPALTANGLKSGLMILIFRQFFAGLPKEIEDASYIDGCTPLRTFISVMLPNAMPAVLTVFLFSVVIYWNDYYTSSVFFRNTKTLALVLENIDNELKKHLFGSAEIQISPREQIVWKEAGCLISIAPLLVMYVCLQKHFTEGIEHSGIVM
ncbi:MAG: carbohydrate ABC transporter permease [Ruminococcus flavefaciens]|nr:carbohydrate ABC transporter permease [Ruminococcus flavefaciens]